MFYYVLSQVKCALDKKHRAFTMPLADSSGVSMNSMESAAATDVVESRATIPLANTIYVAGLSLRCNYCDQLFHFQLDFANHMAIQHDVKNPYICHHCQQSYESKELLIKHVKDVHNDKRFKCDQCGSSYSAKRSLKSHVKRVHEHESHRYTCEHCGKDFLNKVR